MNRTVIAVFAALLVLAFHFACCMWSACILISKPEAGIHQYTSPLFEQPWVIAGNDFPTSSLELEFRKLENDQWSGWGDVTTSFSFDASSAPERLEQYINEELRWQITHNLYSENKRPEVKRILESSAYAKEIHYALSMNYQAGNALPDSIQLRVAIHFIPPPDKAYTLQTSYLNFPAYGPVQ